MEKQKMTSAQFIMDIGLEIHIQLSTKSKLFCDCANNTNTKPNANTCPICLGLPGALPTINQKAVEYAIIFANALNCEINLHSEFDRKNYFYPDLPRGYQITQERIPIAKNGYLTIDDRKYKIERLHIEEEAGKSIHLENQTLLDFNRAGLPLLELVTQPVFHSPLEATNFIKEIQIIAKYLDISKAEKSKGNLRVDANISVRRKGADEPGQRCEVKNINSFRFIRKALRYEFERQCQILQNGDKVKFETRHFNEKDSRTYSLRSKESENDYRFFPEPDLRPLLLDKSDVEKLKMKIPELPASKARRYESMYCLSKDSADQIARNIQLSELFDGICKVYHDYQNAANWLLTNIIQLDENITKLSAKDIAYLLKQIEQKIINKMQATKVMYLLLESEKSPKEIIAELGFTVIDDSRALESLAKKIIEENPDAIEKYKAGKNSIMKFLIGQAKRYTKGAASARDFENKVKEILKF
ncbi:MAG: Asp-tRNA(Asn)/Glu-tRNA(Gln) amidotransferase subunit GatB [Candidatus Zixiibacteriota bacterium]